MIIWGSYVIKKELKAGNFHCPECRTDRGYIHKLPRKWGHLYWIPLFVLDEYDSYIECQSCNGSFKEKVLDYDPRAEEELKTKIIGNMAGQVLIHLYHARKKNLELSEIETFLLKFLGLEKLPLGLDVELTTAITREEMLGLVRNHSDHLTAKGKEIVLQEAVGVNSVDESVRNLAVSIGSEMRLTQAHINAILPIVHMPSKLAPAEEFVAPVKAPLPVGIWD